MILFKLTGVSPLETKKSKSKRRPDRDTPWHYGSLQSRLDVLGWIRYDRLFGVVVIKFRFSFSLIMFGDFGHPLGSAGPIWLTVAGPHGQTCSHDREVWDRPGTVRNHFKSFLFGQIFGIASLNLMIRLKIGFTFRDTIHTIGASRELVPDDR